MSAASPAASWSRSDLRARAVSLVVLGGLVGLTFGLATASYDGARRTDSALPRLQSRTVLAIFLAALGAVAVGHALFSSVYRRRRDFAVLQSLGATRRGIRAMITAQATVVGLAGLLIGVPVGLIAGRAGWQAITDRVPLMFRSPTTVIAVIIVIPVALIATNLLAIIPARRASKAKPALVLRSE
ncbi:MAG: FtsX-like permease family protein [Ilumatobacteraceae bacterium]